MAVLLYFHPQCLLFGLSGLNSEGKNCAILVFLEYFG